MPANNNNRQINKVIGKDYLFRQFQLYDAHAKEQMMVLDRKIARLYLKIEQMQSILNQNNITVDFSDIDALTDEEIDEIFAPPEAGYVEPMEEEEGD